MTNRIHSDALVAAMVTTAAVTVSGQHVGATLYKAEICIAFAFEMELGHSLITGILYTSSEGVLENGR